eukprot:c14439_g1_i2.p1 GENE.c14439_g1_i2~~c14439_g1_i2.p1  ORF type:complete len:212 (+),score=28.33 c14439_g1_i2:181-816(+)
MAVVHRIRWFDRFKCQRKFPNSNVVISAIKQACFNHFFVAIPLSFLLVGNVTLETQLLPRPLDAGLSIALFMVIEDTTFYWCHRGLHASPFLYKTIHKIHHQCQIPVGVCSENTHPIEFVFSNILPLMAGPLLLRSHLCTTWLWIVWRIGATVDDHCGYDFPWSFYRVVPFSGSATFHDLHHSVNTGNYGSFFQWWDLVCATRINTQQKRK